MNSSPQSTSLAQVSSPGQALSRRLAAFLRRQIFDEVLGCDTIDAWQVDWELLENPDVLFSDPRKATLMSQLHTRLKKISRMPDQSDDFRRLHFEFFNLRNEICEIHAERLEVCARLYFAQRFPNAVTVQFLPKLAGMQMGNLTRVTLPDRKLLNYHLKTHSGGRLASNSAAAKRVDPRELLVYKVLEYLGVGCETHFLHRSLEDVFIATLDAGHADGSSFSTFQRATGIHATCGDTIYGETLWGSLHSQLIHHKDFGEIEDNIQSDSIAQNFLLQMASLDMISRIFRLHDLLNNVDNFGFCTSPTGMPCLKVLDFRIMDEANANVMHEHFGGFLVGNGIFNYSRSHITLQYAFRHRLQVERVKTALHLLTEGTLCKSHDCIKRAREDVLLFFESSQFLDCDIEAIEAVTGIIAELEGFCEALHCNVDFFTSALISFSGS